MRDFKIKLRVFSGIAFLAVFVFAAFYSYDTAAVSNSGNVRVQVEVLSSVSMQIESPNDDDLTCVAEAGEEKPSCAFLDMEPDTYRSSYSDITVSTNSDSGYSLTVEAANPNIVNTSDDSFAIRAGILSESGGTVPGGQNKWSFKSDGYIENWTAMSSSPTTVVAYDSSVPQGDTTRVTYGVSTGTIPTGTYTTTLTYTATVYDGDNPATEETEYMQGFTCGSIGRGGSTTLMDRRDRKTYSVAMLADGLCWMTEDLKLGGDYDMQLTSELSDVTSDFVLKAEDTSPWCTTNSAECINQSLMRKTGGEGSNYAPTYLYNWYAATAGSGTYATTSGMTEGSICPKGWKPAHGGTGIGSFASITSTYNTVAALTTTPIPGFNFTGFRTGATVNYPSTGGYYWARSAVDALNANYLVFYSNVVNPQNTAQKYYGFAVRCISTL